MNVDRVLGWIRGRRPGPTLLCIGGLHGNEPAGVLAARRVLESLDGRAQEMAGDFVALAGNRSALAAGRRFIDRDLNRAWSDERVRRLRQGDEREGGREDDEQIELLDALEGVVGEARGPLFVLDLHTTSGPGGVFSSFGDSLPNRELASRLPVPMIFGLEELVQGTLLAYLEERGLVTVGFESGQHEEPDAVDRAEAAVWIAIAATGLLPPDRVTEARAGRRLLEDGANGVPRAFEMLYRHDVVPGDGFHMTPGYRNFQRVSEGEVLGRDRQGVIVAERGARLLMPLYQEQGEDGFFLVRHFWGFWLRASYLLRRLGLDRLAPRLPGVRSDPADPRRLIVDRRVARWYSTQLFHLLGFRRVEDVGARLVVARRSSAEADTHPGPPDPRELG